MPPFHGCKDGRTMIGLRRMVAGTAVSITLFAAMTSTAGAASFVRQSPGVVTAAPFSALEINSARATVHYQVSAGPDESGASVMVCQNADAIPSPDGSGEWECPAFGNSGSSESGSNVELLLPAGSYTAIGKTYVRGQSAPTIQNLEPFAVVDECGWTVKAAVGIGLDGTQARTGDWFPCGGIADFAEGDPAPLAKALDLESTVDRSRLSIDGPGTVTLAPARVGSSGDLNYFLNQAGVGRIDLTTRRRVSRQWAIVTEAAQTALIGRRGTAKLRVTTTDLARRTTVKNLASVRVSVTTFGHGGVSSIPTNLLPRPACIKLRKYTVVLRRGQSTTVRKGKPPSGGEAFARRSCRRG